MEAQRWMKLLSALVIVVAAYATPQVAAGQPGNWQPTPATPNVQAEHKRSGFLIGFSAGSALGDDTVNQTGSMVSFYLGGFLNPNLALMFTVTDFEADEFANDCLGDCSSPTWSATSLEVTGVAMQRWLSDRFFVRIPRPVLLWTAVIALGTLAAWRSPGRRRLLLLAVFGLG